MEKVRVVNRKGRVIDAKFGRQGPCPEEEYEHLKTLKETVETVEVLAGVATPLAEARC